MNRIQTAFDLVRIVPSHDIGFSEHADMGLRACYVLPVELAVVVDGGVDFLHDGIRPFGETAAPHAVAHDFAPRDIKDGTDMTDEEKNRKERKFSLAALSIAALGGAGLIAGLAAVYVINGPEGNGSNASTCQAAIAAGKAAKPFATGELAAFLPAQEPLSVADLSFKDAAGAPLRVSDFKGQTLLLNLWATWCAPCRKEMPALDKLQADLGSEDFAVVTVNVDRGPADKPLKFLNEIGVKDLAFYSDSTMDIFNKLRSRGRAVGLPSTMLVGRDGCEIGSIYGPAEWASEEAKALINAAVGAQKPQG